MSSSVPRTETKTTTDARGFVGLGRDGVDAMVPLLDLLDHVRGGPSSSSSSSSRSSSSGEVDNRRRLEIEGRTGPRWRDDDDCLLPPDATGDPPGEERRRRDHDAGVERSANTRAVVRTFDTGGTKTTTTAVE
jgi:hypothetical protein